MMFSDFFILQDPGGLALVWCVGLIVVYGVALAIVGYERDRRWRKRYRRDRIFRRR